MAEDKNMDKKNNEIIEEVSEEESAVETQTSPTEKEAFNPFKLSNLIKKTPNRFLLTMAVAKRARQLKEGAAPLIDGIEQPPILTALNELHNDKFAITVDEAADEETSLLDDISDYLDTDIDDTDELVDEKNDSDQKEDNDTKEENKKKETKKEKSDADKKKDKKDDDKGPKNKRKSKSLAA